MRRWRIWAIWVLFMAEVAWLWVQPRPDVAPVLASEPFSGLRARSLQTNEGVTFVLEGYPAGLYPSLTVTARERLDEALHYIRPGVVTVTRRHVERYPAQLLSYSWTAGDKEIPGQHLYINPAYPYDWQVRQTDLFSIYYTGRYPTALVQGWAEVYRWLAGFLLLQQPPRQAIYLMPEAADLRRAVNLAPGDSRRLAGLWVEPAESILLAPEMGSAMTSVMVHELTHALLYNQNPIWWEEGIATWIAFQETAHRYPRAKAAAWEATQVALQALHRLALETEISLDQVGLSQTYPLDRYTVGSSFVLYVRARLGQPGVLLLAAAAAARPLDQAVPEILGETLDQAKQRWLAYIRSNRFLEDIANP